MKKFLPAIKALAFIALFAVPLVALILHLESRMEADPTWLKRGDEQTFVAYLGDCAHPKLWNGSSGITYNICYNGIQGNSIVLSGRGRSAVNKFIPKGVEVKWGWAKIIVTDAEPDRIRMIVRH